MSGHHPDCYLARYGTMENGDPMPPCDGRLVKVHLIPRQLLKREGFHEAIHDNRSWVWGCGGPMGNSGHHGHLDQSRRLRIPYDCLPLGTIQLADELGLDAWLERTYAA